MSELLAEKVMQSAINSEHLAYCPTMDLIVLGTMDECIHLYRLNGQEVFAIPKPRDEGKIRHIRWKPNGITTSICCLGWGFNFTDGNTLNTKLNKLKAHLTLDDVIDQKPETKDLDIPLDLPKHLAFFESERVLPKLSPLSPGGIEDDIFNSRTSLETMFRPMAIGATDSADLLVVGFEDGTVHLSIYDYFEIGQYLSILASKSTQLQNLLRYIRQVQVQMYSDFKASQDLPNRFISNIDEALNDRGAWNWAQVAYHLVVTGDCPLDVRQWLVDQVGERGHKRWEKAVMAGYESVRRLAHEHLLPALERFIVLASRLRGLSKFQVSNVDLGLTTQDLDNVIDTVSCLQLITHQILIISGSELRQFQAFSAWLRQEIDIQASDATNLESLESVMDIDHTSTLEFVRGAMVRSALTQFFDLQGDAHQRNQWDLAAEGGTLFELYKIELKKDTVHDQHAKQLPCLDALISHLNTQCSAVFRGIAETQRRNVRIGPPISLGRIIPNLMDMRMLAGENNNAECFTQYVAVSSQAELDQVCIFRITLVLSNGMSAVENVGHTTINVEGWKIQDIKFADDNDLILALSTDSESRLFLVPYRPKVGSGKGLSYNADFVSSSEQRDRNAELSLIDPHSRDEYTWLKFAAGASWTPKCVVVNGRKTRRAACVVTEDGFHYRVYDLDSRQDTV
ncbi:MAG: hypothetical protein Q9217_003089 [Psora testacea]